jgi:hypothetical protein
MRNQPTTSQLAKTAARLQARQPTAYEPPTRIIKRGPPPGSVTTCITRIVSETPKVR